MYCPACGVKNDGGDGKCFICGYAVPAGGPSERASSERRRRTNGNGTTITEPFAAIGDRMLALILDRVVVVALLAIPASLIAANWASMGARLTTPLYRAIAAATIVLMTILVYHIVLEALFGATIGKGLLGLHVRNGGEKWLASTIRNVARLIDAIVLYSLAFLFAAFSSRRQRLGDHLAGTIVVEHPVPAGARVALIVIWLAVVGGSLWIAGSLCPSCLPELRLPF